MSSGCGRLARNFFVAMLGGGAGTFASLGAQGPSAVQAGMGKHLGMEPMRVPSRTLGDHLAENICLFGLLAATCSKIAREIYTLMKTEFGEVEEPVPPGTVGSSTMPQKRNPKLCQDIIAAAAEVRASVPLALEAMQAEHEAEIFRRCPRQHRYSGGHDHESHHRDDDLQGVVGEALVKQPDTQDDCPERADDDQDRLGHAQRPDVQGGLL